jgi:hypothetical protein
VILWSSASNILLISVCGIIIFLSKQFFHNNQSVYNLFDILSNWKILLQIFNFLQDSSFWIFDSLLFYLLHSKTSDYFSTSDCLIFYYLFAFYGFYRCDSQGWWYKLSHMALSDANSPWESWYFRICWWLKKVSKLIWCRFWSWRCWNWWSSDQFVDILTKGLSTPLFRRHCSNLMLGSSKHAIEGECQDIKGPTSATCLENRE